MNSGRKKRSVKGIVIAAAAVAVCMAASLLAGAVWNENDAVQVNPASIESSTLIVGTHLIHISAATNTLYELALDLAGESGQERVYYKSELAGGAWFDITTAATLEDITTGGVAVSDEEIGKLLLTHHTKSDGITYDLRTGAAVNIFDIRSPYDLESMEELFPLKTQYDLTREMQGDSDFGKRKIALISTFFQTNVKNAATEESDRALAALQRYYAVLSENDGGAAEMDAVQSVMDAVDAARRAEVLQIVDGALQELAKTLQTVADTAGDKENEGSKGSGADPDLQTAVNDSISGVSDAQLLAAGKMLSEGVTVLSGARYDASRRLIDAANADNHADCDGAVADILALDQIQGGTVSNQKREARLLEESLIPAASALFTGKLAAGENAEYRAAVSQNAAEALKSSVVKRAGSALGILRSELEFFIDALTQRMETQDAMDYVRSRLESARGYGASVPADAFEVIAGGEIDAHIDFLTRLARRLELKLGGNDADKLLAQKAALQKELMSALDKNDLAGAKTLEGRIADLDDQLVALPGGDGQSGRLANDLLSQAKDAADRGNSEDLMQGINALGDLLSTNFAAVFPVLEELHGDLVKKCDLEGKDFQDAIDAIEELLLNNKDAYDAALRGGLTAEEAEGIITDFLNGSGAGSFFGDGLLSGADGDLSGLSAYEKDLIPILALNMYRDETGDLTLDGLLRARAQRQYDLRNPYVYGAIQTSSVEYLPASTVAYVQKMRYVWNRNLSEATLARGGTYYFYTVYSSEVLTGKGKDGVGYMTAPALYQGGVHLPEDYAFETFGLWAEYLPGAKLGAAVNETLNGHAVELFTRFLQAAM